MAASGSELASAGSAALAGMTTDAAVILDNSPAALALRSALDIQGDDVVHAVDRARLLEALDAGAYALDFEALYLRAEPPAASVAVLVLHACGTWTGYCVDGELHEIDEVEGEIETRGALIRQYHATLN